MRYALRRRMLGKAGGLAAIVLIGLAAIPAPADAQDGPILISPEQVGQIFCIARLGNDMAPVEALLTPDLTGAIAVANAKDAAFETAHPGDKPPLGDGIPWQAVQDYAATCDVGKVTATADSVEVELNYGFPDYPDANFTDRLVLKPVPDPSFGANRWRIDNVVYAGEGDLRTTLMQVFEGY